MARLTCSQSSIEKVPSGRSAMICRVGPLRRTRTSLNPRLCSTGSAKATTRRAGPVSRVSRVSVMVCQATKKAGPGWDPLSILHFRGYVSEPKLPGDIAPRPSLCKGLLGVDSGQLAAPGYSRIILASADHFDETVSFILSLYSGFLPISTRARWPCRWRRSGSRALQLEGDVPGNTLDLPPS